MKKSILLEVVVGIIFAVFFGYFVFIGFNAGSPEENSTIDRKITKLSDEEKFVQFGADISCERFKYTEAVREIKDDSDQRDALREEYSNTTALIREKYGYEEDEVESLSQKYEEDLHYAESVVDRVRTLCPEAVPELEENIEIMKSGISVRVIINEDENSATINYKYFEDGYINEGSRSSSADIEDIYNTIRESFGEELADQAIKVAKFEYE